MLLIKVFRSTFSLRRTHTYLYKMDKAYLRRLSDSDQFDLTFQYRNPSLKIERMFNFKRLLSETAQTFVSRVATNLEKVVNKKNKKRLEPLPEVTVKLFVNDGEVKETDVCRDIFNEVNKIKLSIMESDYEVLVNVAFIDGIVLPKNLMAGFPIYPRFEAAFTDVKLSDFTWFKSKDKLTWTKCGDCFNYTPQNDEIEFHLKFSCLPRNERNEGPIFETVTEGTISASPGECPFETRHLFTKERTKPNEFRVVTYNILADLYCDSDYTREVLHPYCPPYALTIDYRKQLILKEVIGFQGDVICMQEVDRKVYVHDFQPLFDSLNYGSHFTIKGGSVAEGVTTVYNLNKFRLLDSEGIILSEAVKTNEIFDSIKKTLETNRQLSERFYERQTAAQLTILQSVESENILIVANTHLYFHPDADHIRLLQAATCIKYVEDAHRKLTEAHPTKRIAIVFCGDFNSVPSCGIYQLYTEGKVDSDYIDWQSNKEEAVKDLSVEQPFKLDSACGTPQYTNFTAGFADCLDYIFYDRTNLTVSQVVPLPSNEELTRHTALPSVVFPSDHISLVADLKWR